MGADPGRTERSMRKMHNAGRATARGPGGGPCRLRAVLEAFGVGGVLTRAIQWGLRPPAVRVHRALWAPGRRRKGMLLLGAGWLAAMVGILWLPGFFVPLAALIALTVVMLGASRLYTRTTSAIPAGLPPPPGNEPVEAQFDRDGYALRDGGSLAHHPTTSPGEFVPTEREVTLVDIDGRLAVRKRFAERGRFAREVVALCRLDERPFTPDLVGVDREKLTIWTEYIDGPTLRLLLAERGARTLERSFADGPGQPPLGSRERRDAMEASGREHMKECVDGQFVEAAFADLQAMHRAGLAWCDVKYGNILVHASTGEPRFVDFADTHVTHAVGSLEHEFLCDRDIEDFNRIFGTEKMTRDRLASALASSRIPYATGAYAPVDVGKGIRAGSPWNVNSGTGSWHYILRRNLPELSGKRILDLRCNNGVIGLHMLREGAGSAVGLELSDPAADQAQIVHAGFEWADRRAYDFTVVRGDMTRVCDEDLGHFDIALALCALHYLDEADLSRVVRCVRRTADLFVVQCNTDARDHDGDMGRRAMPEYLCDRLEQNGFTVSSVDAPPGYSRPVIVARAVSPADGARR